MITALDQDDERILKVLKKITDTISLPNLMKMKTFLLSVVQSLAFTPSLCTIIISTLFSISKSIAKISTTNSKGSKGQQFIFIFCDLQLWLRFRLNLRKVVLLSYTLVV